jgi:hypothetical protein
MLVNVDGGLFGAHPRPLRWGQRPHTSGLTHTSGLHYPTKSRRGFGSSELSWASVRAVSAWRGKTDAKERQ